MSAPKGLKIFQQFFADFVGQYVLIGGTANFLAMITAWLLLWSIDTKLST